MANKDRWVRNEDGTAWVRESNPGGLAINATEGAVRAAEELGIDLSDVKGTGEGGRISKSDVDAVANA